MNSNFDQVGSRSTYVNIQSSPCWYWHTSRRRPSNGLLHWQFWMKWMTGRWRLTCSLAKANTSLSSPYFVIWPFSTVFEILLGVSFFGFAHSTFRWQSRPSEGPQSAVDQNTKHYDLTWFWLILTVACGCRLRVTFNAAITSCAAQWRLTLAILQDMEQEKSWEAALGCLQCLEVIYIYNHIYIQDIQVEPGQAGWRKFRE